ncbi:hypothetical protein JTE90_002489 [Oedothorax gibbosus]|uniref:Uncharacterized protein n=1 Tax=Oedothorax gibbosus TaxID=931172 RepID=A0AAV6TSS4_9ARAC|nr:hypothetical protein JTE90_002489 [Oedothorax gibbosus]
MTLPPAQNDMLYIQPQHELYILSEEFLQNISTDYFSELDVEMPPPPPVNPVTSPRPETMSSQLNVEIPPPPPVNPVTSPRPETMSSQSRADMASSSEFTRKWPFQTDFVASPWTRRRQPLMKPPLESRRSLADISEAHVAKTSHTYHLMDMLGAEEMYEIKESAPDMCTEPMDLKVN